MESRTHSQARDEAIETACSNMFLARELERRDIPHYMSFMARLSDIELAQVVRGSELIYGRYLEIGLPMN